LIGGPNQSHNVNFKELFSKEKEGQKNLFISASSIPFLKIFQNPKFKELPTLPFNSPHFRAPHRRECGQWKSLPSPQAFSEDFFNAAKFEQLACDGNQISADSFQNNRASNLYPKFITQVLVAPNTNSSRCRLLN
jgi:hypothetical protein